METIISILLFLPFLLLFYPTVYEIKDDWYADHNKKKDVITRIKLSFVVCLIDSVVHWVFLGESWWYIFKPALMTFAIFLQFFDYFTGWRFGKKEWFSYTNGKGYDKYLAMIHPVGRLAIKLTVFIVALIFYFS